MEVQARFGDLYSIGDAARHGPAHFDHLFREGETFRIGSAVVTVAPGHTPADVACQVGDAVYVGDTMFIPELGCARADFPGAMRYTGPCGASLRCPATRLFVCHDRAPPWRPQLRSSGRGTSTSGTVSTRTRTSRCAPHVTPPWICRR